MSVSLSIFVAGVSTEVHPPHDELLDVEQQFEVVDIVGKEEGERAGKGGEREGSSRKKDRNKTTGACMCTPPLYKVTSEPRTKQDTFSHPKYHPCMHFNEKTPLPHWCPD